MKIALIWKSSANNWHLQLMNSTLLNVRLLWELIILFWLSNWQQLTESKDYWLRELQVHPPGAEVHGLCSTCCDTSSVEHTDLGTHGSRCYTWIWFDKRTCCWTSSICTSFKFWPSCWIIMPGWPSGTRIYMKNKRLLTAQTSDGL